MVARRRGCGWWGVRVWVKLVGGEGGWGESVGKVGGR